MKSYVRWGTQGGAWLAPISFKGIDYPSHRTGWQTSGLAHITPSSTPHEIVEHVLDAVDNHLTDVDRITVHKRRHPRWPTRSS